MLVCIFLFVLLIHILRFIPLDNIKDRVLRILGIEFNIMYLYFLDSLAPVKKSHNVPRTIVQSKKLYKKECKLLGKVFYFIFYILICCLPPLFCTVENSSDVENINPRISSFHTTQIIYITDDDLTYYITGCCRCYLRRRSRRCRWCCTYRRSGVLPCSWRPWRGSSSAPPPSTPSASPLASTSQFPDTSFLLSDICTVYVKDVISFRFWLRKVNQGLI